MRSCFFITMFSMCCTTIVSATEKDKFIHDRHSVQLSIGDPVMAFDNFNNGFNPSPNYQDWFSPDNELLYQTETATFIGSYAYALKPWLQLGATVLYAGAYDDVIYRPTGEKVAPARQHVFAVIPDVKFEYFRRKYCTLYSGASLGIAVAHASGYDLVASHETLKKWQSAVAYQLTFFGLRVGNRVFGTTDIGYGYKGYFNIGVGYRF